MVSLRIPPPILMIIMASAMFFLAKYVGIASFDFPGRRALAISFAVTGFTIDLISIVAFFRAKTTVNPLAPARAQKLVISGLYRYSRNPMYLGLALTLTGWFFWLGALPTLRSCRSLHLVDYGIPNQTGRTSALGEIRRRIRRLLQKSATLDLGYQRNKSAIFAMTFRLARASAAHRPGDHP